jgi:hypothetical protein
MKTGNVWFDVTIGVLVAAALGCQREASERWTPTEPVQHSPELVTSPCSTAWVRSKAPSNASAFLDVAEQWVNFQDVVGHEPSTGVRYCTPTICGGTATCCWADVDWELSGTHACFASTFNAYRRDCSGFISNVWGLPTPGRITSGFAPYDTTESFAVAWDDLVVGDAINIDTATRKHILLFAGWYDAGHTQFCAYEEFACGRPNYLGLRNKADYTGWNPIRKRGWTPLTYNAQWSNQFYQASMTSGQRLTAWLEFRNTGSLAWDTTNTRIGTQNPQDHNSPFADWTWIAPNRPAAVGAPTAPGDPNPGRFTFVLQAPSVSTTTTYREYWQPVQEGVMWFGPPPPGVWFEITVSPSPPPPPPPGGPFSGSGCNGQSGAVCLATYPFNVTAGRTYTISTCPNFTGDTYLVVSGACSCFNDDYCQLGSSCSCTATSTGTATICASTFGSQCASWNYTVSTAPACTGAGPFIGSGTNGQSGAVCLATYPFNTVAGATYKISTCGGFTGDTYLVVSGSCSCRNDDFCGLGSECTCTATSTGTAYVCASSFGSSDASWNYQVSCL